MFTATFVLMTGACTARTLEVGGGSTSGDEVEASEDDATSSSDVPLDCSQCNAQVAPDPGCHSTFDPASWTCDCDPGYVYATDDLDDFTCVPGRYCGSDPHVEPYGNGRCICAEGYGWCSPDPDDLTCCESA